MQPSEVQEGGECCFGNWLRSVCLLLCWGGGLLSWLPSKFSSCLEILTTACALPGKGVAWRTDSGRDSFLKGGVVDYQRREGKRLNLAVVDLGQATNHCAGLMHVLIFGSSDRLAGRHQNWSRGSHTPSIQLRTVESPYLYTVHCQNLKVSTLAILKFIRSELLGGFLPMWRCIHLLFSAWCILAKLCDISLWVCCSVFINLT